MDDVGLWRYMPCEPPTTLEAMDRVIASALAGAAAGTDVPMVIIDQTTARPCGSTRYLDIQPPNRSLEIGWTWHSVAVQRTSINTECKYLLLRHAFETLGCVRVQLKCDSRNRRSHAAILRIGATYEGTLRRQRILWDGYIRDADYFSVLDHEWPAVKQRLEARLAEGGLTV